MNNIVEELWNIGKLEPYEIIKNLYWIQIDTNWQAKIKELEWKNIADIWAWFSQFMQDIIPLTWWKWKYICTDPIFASKQKTQQALSESIEVYTEVTDKDKKTLNFASSAISKEDFEEMLTKYSKRKFKRKKLASWEKSSKIVYKTKIEKDDKIDIAFCTNVFYAVPHPVKFIEDILENLNNNWELVITDYKAIDRENIILLIELSKQWIIEMIGWDNYLIFKIKKEEFFKKIDKIRKLENEIENKNPIEDILEKALEKFAHDLVETFLELPTEIELSREDLINNNFWVINPILLEQILEFKEQMLKRPYNSYRIEMLWEDFTFEEL